jgi:GTPase SAR1 family protein
MTFDMTEAESFYEGVNEWYEELKKITQNFTSVCLVGNKIDKKEERKVEIEDIRRKAEEMNAIFHLTCAFSDEKCIEVNLWVIFRKL